MTDQADTLRRLMQKHEQRSESQRALSSVQVISVSSGKKGVGRSTLVANLGALLARSGLRIMLLDENQRLTGLENYDVVLLDAGTEMRDPALFSQYPNHHQLVIVTPDPASLESSYGLIKFLKRRGGASRVSVIVNQVTDGREGLLIFQKLRDVAVKFLDVQLEYLGHCPYDEKFAQSILKRKILLDLYPGAPSVASLELLAKRLKSKHLGWEETARSESRNTAGFWRTLLGEVKT